MSDALRYGRPKLVYECDPGDEDEDEPPGLTRIRSDFWQNYKEAPPVHGWRRMHALASMRACVGVLSFAAMGVRGGQQCMAIQSSDQAEQEREWDRANR